MTITARSNIASLGAQVQLGRITKELGTSFERLSSGLRINSAADDPAGLAVADSLRAQTRVASVAIRNANDGISLTSIADEALGEIAQVLTRMSELAIQSANGSYTNAQRSALSTEFLALGSEVERISRVTTFNDIALLSGSSAVTLQVGLDSSANSRITIGSVLSTLDSLGLATAGSSALSVSIIAMNVADSQQASYSAYSSVQSALATVSNRRGTIGAGESRLSVAINYLTAARENYIAAESRIRDVDVAQEVTNSVRLRVLQQSASAILAQANQQPQIVLELLQ